MKDELKNIKDLLELTVRISNLYKKMKREGNSNKETRMKLFLKYSNLMEDIIFDKD